MINIEILESNSAQEEINSVNFPSDSNSLNTDLNTDLTLDINTKDLTDFEIKNDLSELPKNVSENLNFESLLINPEIKDDSSSDLPEEISSSSLNESGFDIDFSMPLSLDLNSSPVKPADNILLSASNLYDYSDIHNGTLTVDSLIPEGSSKLQLELACLYAQNGDKDGAKSTLMEILSSNEDASIIKEAERILNIISR